MSRANECILKLHDLGYVMDRDGNFKDPRGEDVSISMWQGYYKFSHRLTSNVQPSNVYLHKFQAYQKYGSEVLNKGVIVRHYNDDRTDNSWENIRIGTCRDNTLDYKRNKPELFKETQKRASKAGGRVLRKFSEAEEDIILDLHINHKWTNQELANKYEVNKSTMWYVLNRLKKVKN